MCNRFNDFIIKHKIVSIPANSSSENTAVRLDIVGKVQGNMDEKDLLVAFLLVCKKLLIPLPTIFWSMNDNIIEKQMEWCYKRKI